MVSPAEVLDFWFGAQQDGFSSAETRQRWFVEDPDFDRLVIQRFGGLVEKAASEDLMSWCNAPESRLALILICDQFSRNLFRSDSRAYALDAMALRIAGDGINTHHDRKLTPDERSFFYMPFMHSESLLDQHTSVGLFSQLRQETSAGFKHLTGNSLRHAQQHRDVILKFGRFPLRNDALGRLSSKAESRYLEDGER